MKKNNKKNFLIILVMILTSLVLQGCGNGGIGEDAENQMIRTYNKVATDLKITPDYAPRPYLIAMTDSLCYFGQETLQSRMRSCSIIVNFIVNHWMHQMLLP